MPLFPIILNTVYVGNLEFTATEEDVIGLLSPIGRVLQAKISKSPDGQSRGYAFARFETEDQVLEAVAKLSQSLFQGRTITLAEVRNPNVVIPWRC